MSTTSRACVRKEIAVDVEPERAFFVFTEGVDSWWIRTHHVGESELAEVVMEPKAGGRWYGRGVDGVENDFAQVRVWEPPSRLVIAWQLTADWQYDPGFVTEIEVTFNEQAPNRTLVTLEHRDLDKFGTRRDEISAALDGAGGWTGLLAAYGDAAKG